MYQLIMFGVNYQTANLDIRERLAVSSEKIPLALKRLSSLAKEVLVLSTCNRTEVYCITNDINSVINALCDMQNVCPRTLAKFSYIHTELDCVKHLFQVVSGLDSMVLGETEIVAQIKQAMQFASNQAVLGTHLSGLMQMALSVAKDIRNTTEINNVAISMGNALVNLMESHSNNLNEESLLFIGAGQMMQKIAPHFSNVNLVRKSVINRSFENADKLAARINATPIDLSHIANVIYDYSIIFACAESDELILTKQLLNDFLQNRKNLLIIDLSVPLLSDIRLCEYPNIKLITVDDIAKIVDVGLEKRKLAADEAHEIIENKLNDYQHWLKKRTMAPLIKAIRADAESMRQEALTNAQKLLQNGEAPDDVLRQFSVQLMNKMLHNPTVNLCSSQGMRQDDLLDLVGYLYGIDILKQFLHT